MPRLRAWHSMPPVSTVAPLLTQSATWRETLSTATRSIKGPIVLLPSNPSPQICSEIKEGTCTFLSAEYNLYHVVCIIVYICKYMYRNMEVCAFRCMYVYMYVREIIYQSLFDSICNHRRESSHHPRLYQNSVGGNASLTRIAKLNPQQQLIKIMTGT